MDGLAWKRVCGAEVQGCGRGVRASWSVATIFLFVTRSDVPRMPVRRFLSPSLPGGAGPSRSVTVYRRESGVSTV